jgi:acetyltransferase-like isoleucine patch superfamily enzyme
MEQEKPSMTPQQAEITEAITSNFITSLRSYKEIAVGKDAGYVSFLKYELYTLLFSNLPGIAGLGLRQKVYKSLFNRIGRGAVVGRGIILRNPAKVSLGSGVIIEDYCCIDAKGNNPSITLDDFVTISRFSTITAKSAKISIGKGVNVGSYTRIASQSCIEIEESVLIAAYCYIGPGNHARHQGNLASKEPSKPLIEREMEIKGGVKIGKHCWIGAHTTVMDGVTIGEGSIIGAHSLVKESIPSDSIAVGVPAKVISMP